MRSTYCCGKSNEQYCCTLQEKMQENPSYNGGGTFYDNSYTRTDADTQNTVGLIVAGFISVSLLICICVGICLFCTQKKRIYELVSQKN